MSQMLAVTIARESRIYTPSSPDSVRVTPVASRVVPGLEYYWGTYRPPRMVDAFIYAVVAGRGGALRPVRTPDEWMEAAGWFQPVTGENAVAACGEIVAVTSRHRSPYESAVVYHSPATLDSLPTMVPNPARLRSVLGPPSIERLTDGGWQVDLWAIEVRDVTKYRCRITPQSAALTVSESLEMSGFSPG
ncbi:MAG TPA: hypothetical protein VFJ16_14110 [Longimicrobium sp.]|nr:hypothetical protein [Longimicrobium sp.]